MVIVMRIFLLFNRSDCHGSASLLCPTSWPVSIVMTSCQYTRSFLVGSVYIYIFIKSSKRQNLSECQISVTMFGFISASLKTFYTNFKSCLTYMTLIPKTCYYPFWCWPRNIPGESVRYLLCHQVISDNGINTLRPRQDGRHFPDDTF